MKFPRNAKIFRGQLDATPFAGVFFLLLMFLLLASLVYTPGVLITLPMSTSELPGVDGPKLAVAMDPNGQLYFEGQIIQKKDLQRRLREEVRKSSQPLTLVVQADKAVTLEQWDSLADMAREAGMKHILQQTLPRVFDASADGTGQ